jgi:hypothetical protein
MDISVFLSPAPGSGWVRLDADKLSPQAVVVALAPSGDLMTIKTKESPLPDKTRRRLAYSSASRPFWPGGIFAQVACYIEWIEL